jgi:hypothetical protein
MEAMLTSTLEGFAALTNGTTIELREGPNVYKVRARARHWLVSHRNARASLSRARAPPSHARTLAPRRPAPLRAGAGRRDRRPRAPRPARGRLARRGRVD